MIQAFKNWFDEFRGSGDHSISVPPMDGALRSNNALEDAEKLFDASSPANVVHDGKVGYFSSGPSLFRFGVGAAPEPIAQFESEVSALALQKGVLAIGLAGGEVHLKGGGHDGLVLALSCPVAIAFRDANTLVIANGSTVHKSDEWRQNLLRRNATGHVLEWNMASGETVSRAEGLSWPYGVLPLPDGVILVSEAGRAQLILLRPDHPPKPVLTDLPAYPARIMPKSVGDGAWLPMFAPRRRIVELVMRDQKFREAMMAEIEPRYWIAPSLRPMESYYEPLQGGTLKRLAILKPWAPSRSYGLVVELDAEFQPIRSFHSRADGKRHGVSSCAAVEDRLIIAATGGDCIISLGPMKAEE